MSPLNINNINNIETPATVVELSKLKSNLKIVDKIKQATNCQMLLALKAFSTIGLFNYIKPHFDGTTASGIYEAKLGKTYLGKQVHTYSPAYDLAEIKQLAKISSHIYFNSINQYDSFKPFIKKVKCGLRINPEFSCVEFSMYNPCQQYSRFGVVKKQLPKNLPPQIDTLHFHALCESNANTSAKLLDHIAKNFSPWVKQVKYVNIGGGHYFSKEGYELDILINAINKFQKEFGVKIILEPGGAVVYNSGFLITKVLDIIKNDKQIAILNTSATCHMPDVLEMPYRPKVMGDGNFKHKYVLGGKTCLSGDIIGEYAFEKPLKIEDKVIFCDMIQYTTVKTTTFNGVPLPELGFINEKGTYKRIKKFGFNDFKSRLS